MCVMVIGGCRYTVHVDIGEWVSACNSRDAQSIAFVGVGNVTKINPHINIRSNSKVFCCIV